MKRRWGLASVVSLAAACSGAGTSSILDGGADDATTPAKDATTDEDGAVASDASPDVVSDAPDLDSSDSSDSSDADAGTPSDAGADCANVPQPKASNGPYCFIVLDGGGGGTNASKNCNSAQNEICCQSGSYADGGFAPSSCTVATEDTTGYVAGSCTYNGATSGDEYHCTEGAHCPGNAEVCCAIPSDAGSPKPSQNNDYPGCQAYFQSGKFTGGTRCKDTCNAGDIQLCSSDAECKAGKCVPLVIAGRYTGFCKL